MHAEKNGNHACLEHLDYFKSLILLEKIYLYYDKIIYLLSSYLGRIILVKISILRPKFKQNKYKSYGKLNFTLNVAR
jgi:hypothetical protein